MQTKHYKLCLEVLSRQACSQIETVGAKSQFFVITIENDCLKGTCVLQVCSNQMRLGGGAASIVSGKVFVYEKTVILLLPILASSNF